jgi:hypothetical protein
MLLGALDKEPVTVKKTLAAALAFVAFSAVQASAITIDFTNAAWNPNGDDTITVGQTTVASVPQIPLGTLSWSNSNGFGVTSWLDPEPTVGSWEALTITFLQPFVMTSFSLANLGILDSGFYKVNGGATQSFSGTLSGNKTVSFSPVAVTTLVLGYDNFQLISDFNLKSVTGDFQTTQPPSVPEPTSMVLLGTGLAGLVARARRKKA